MSWTVDTTRIYVEKLDEDTKNIIARLQPLNNKTILHHFGYESDVYKLSGIVVTDTDKDALKAMARTSTAYLVSGPEGQLGNFYVKNVKSSRMPIICITLYDRPGLDTASPVYMVDMELYIVD